MGAWLTPLSCSKQVFLLVLFWFSIVVHVSGPNRDDFRPGEVILMDGGFRGREHVVTPWPKPPKKQMPKYMTQYNDGHSFIRS